MLENTKARLVVDLAGGVITEFSLKNSTVNPLHNLGHFLAFDRWGPSTRADQNLGIPFHGEASSELWSLDPAPASGTVEMSVTLPIVKLSMHRKITLDPQEPVVKVVEEISSQNLEPRTYNVVQHVTIGAPFLDGTTILNTGAARGFHQSVPIPPSEENIFDWPDAVLQGDSIDLRVVEPSNYPTSSVVSFVYDNNDSLGWVTAVNPTSKTVLGYIWYQEQYPWFNLWTKLEQNVPVARGLEFGTTGLHKPWPELIQTGQILQTPLYETIMPTQKVYKIYFAFLGNLPENFLGVESLGLNDQSITLTETGANREVVIPFSLDIPTAQ